MSFSFILGLAVMLSAGSMMQASLFRGSMTEWSKRVTVALGLTMCIPIPGGFLLNILPGGLSTWNWAAYEGAVLIAACALYWARGGAMHLPVWKRTGRPPVLPAALLLACFVVPAALYGIDRRVAAEYPRTAFTQFWVLPGKTRTGQVDRLRVGMSNHEGAVAIYRVALATQRAVLWHSAPIRLTNGTTSALSLPLSSLCRRVCAGQGLTVTLTGRSARGVISRYVRIGAGIVRYVPAARRP